MPGWAREKIPTLNGSPPTDPLDFAGWDQYWKEQIECGFGPPLIDMFCDDRDLVRAMNSEGMKSVLCAGNGLSQEPRALAQAGFEVVAVDASPQTVDLAQRFEFPAEAFEHYCEPGTRRPGGHAEFVVGDILDRAVCPGPFDVIIERCTAQLYRKCNTNVFLEALVARLSRDGILLSHCHHATFKQEASSACGTRPWF